MLMLAALLAMISVLVAAPRPGAIPSSAPGRRIPRDGKRGDGHPGVSPAVVAVVTGLGCTAAWLLLGGWLGAGSAVMVLLVLPRALARLEPAGRRRTRQQVLRDAPLVADLLAACLLAGVPLGRSIPAAAAAVQGPCREILMEVHQSTSLGATTSQAWSAARAVEGLELISKAIIRSERTGAPLADLLMVTAEELRSAAEFRAQAEVRSLSVRAVLPLGLCLLPAFVLLGVVPVVAGLTFNL